MRPILTGLILLLLVSVVQAQPKGEIESIGFNGRFRPDCWTPMVVRLTPGTAPAGKYQLQVKQYDLDGDRPIFTRLITLNAEDQGRTQRYWMYFIPEPVDRGLPDITQGSNIRDLQKRLEVLLCSDDGKKEIARLPVTQTIFSLDPASDTFATKKGSKLILCVTDGSSQPAWRDYEQAVGLVEDVEFVTLQARDLPTHLLGYDSVDGIVWLNADPADLQKSGEDKLQVLRDYVKTGGRLVICTGSEWQKALGFADLLPVTLQGNKDSEKLEPLRSLARSGIRADDPWNIFKGPFTMARAEVRPGATVDDWIDWKSDDNTVDHTPYLVRKGYGLGSVIWVAQNLGDPQLTAKAAPGWPFVWDAVFDWKNDLKFRRKNITDDEWNAQKRYYDQAYGVDLGKAFSRNADLEPGSKTAAFVSLALFFFVLYWIVAGPGGYLILAARRRTQFSWMVFALTAIGATLFTVLVVKLVLRGAPELRHVTIVQMVSGQPAQVSSRFGLYIPKDGPQTIEIKNPPTDGLTTLCAFAPHPANVNESSYKPATVYEVPVRDIGSNEAASIAVPYRSTLKKFSARWTGDLGSGVVGQVKLDSVNQFIRLAGKLTNSSGLDLTDVYLVFQPRERGNLRRQIKIIYLPRWKKDNTLHLPGDLPPKPAMPGVRRQEGGPGQLGIQSDGIPIVGDVADTDTRNASWVDVFYAPLRGRGGDKYWQDDRSAFPILSLFNGLPPAREETAKSDRFELLRRGGGRQLDLSQAVSAGQLVILASVVGTSDKPNPIPLPLEVGGSKMEGNGKTFYQFVLPIERGDVDLPATQPVAP